MRGYNATEEIEVETRQLIKVLYPDVSDVLGCELELSDVVKDDLRACRAKIKVYNRANRGPELAQLRRLKNLLNAILDVLVHRELRGSAKAYGQNLHAEEYDAYKYKTVPRFRELPSGAIQPLFGADGRLEEQFPLK